jgi:Glycosyl transferase family 2
LSLVLSLDRPLPASLPVASATAIFCAGSCFHDEHVVKRLEISVDGVAHRASAWGMPRPDVAAAHAGSAAAVRSHNSGFWAMVPVPARHAPGEIVLEVAARLGVTGATATAELGRIEVVGPEAPLPVTAQPARPSDGLIAICMATFEPDLDLLAAQLESLRAQIEDSWICVISDDRSSLERYTRIVELVDADPRFAISRSSRRLGFYRNFERALRMAPAGASLIALCDQDDRWHPDKLLVLRGALGEASLVYSNQRLVQGDGAVLRDTLWRGRRNNYENLTSMLVANTITGAATLFRRELLETVLPFPDTPGFQFHDAWLAVAALASGSVAYVDRPLYDYVQHPGAVFGDVTHGPRRRSPGGLAAAAAWWRGARRSERWRASYFYGYLAREAQAQVLLARLGPALAASKRRALERFVACDSSPAALAWLWLRVLRALAGRTETLGSENGLAQGVAWKLLAAALASGRPVTRGPLCDASIPGPQSFSQKRLRRWRARL